MADIPVTGKVRIAWVKTVASAANPTTSELNAGLRVDSKVTEMQGFTATTNEIDTSKVNSLFDSKSPGTGSFSNSTIVVAEDDTDNSIVTTLEADQLTSGYLYVRQNVDADTAWTDDDEVDVWPVTIGVISPQDMGARNTILRRNIPVTINADPTFRAVVGSSA